MTLLSRMVLVADDEAVAAFRQYSAGGLASAVKPTVTKEYQSLEQTLVATSSPTGAAGVPFMMTEEAGSRGDGIDAHLALTATLDFEQSQGHWPRLHSEEDAAAVVELAEAASAKHKGLAEAGGEAGCVWAQKVEWGFPSGEARPIDALRVGRFARFLGTELTGFAAFLGGVVAQEVIKKTGKFTPIEQWIHHEDHALVTDECPANLGPVLGTRYDDQIAVLGKDFQARCAEARVFMVGCGALGCEYLKGLSLMGAATSRRGKVLVTDMDTIETSNLSRQFLFRDSDVGHSKSISGARVVKGWNPQMNVEGVEKFVGQSTEDTFDDEFWSSLDVCWNALDNVAARKYTDSRCLWYGKPLLESGTTGTKSNSEVILPFRTNSYNDGVDPPEVGIAMCTLRSFPFLPLHCIEFAKQKLFTEHYEFGPAQYKAFKDDMAGFFEQLGAMSTDNERLTAMRSVMKMVELQKAKGTIEFGTCIQLAFERLMLDFRHDILSVIATGDDMEASGKPFWTGTKRKPNPVDFTADDHLSMEYLYAAANLFAVVFQVEEVRDRAGFEAKVRAMEHQLVQPEFSPKKVMTEEKQAGGEGAAAAAEEEAEEDAVDEEELARLEGALYGVDPSSLQPVVVHDFEKDDDDNWHIDFLTASANLRAWNYNIKATPRHAVKVSPTA